MAWRFVVSVRLNAKNRVNTTTAQANTANDRPQGAIWTEYPRNIHMPQALEQGPEGTSGNLAARDYSP